MYRPTEPFTVAMKLLIPTWETINGVAKKNYPDPETVTDEYIVNGSLKTFGGTMVDNNGIVSIENTATIDTWYRPDIKADCRLYVLDDGSTYELMGDPENINRRNQFLKLKVKRVGGRNG